MLIVKNTIPKEEIEDMMDDLLKYMSANDAFPAGSQNQSVYEIYWSQAQMRARQHENMYLTQKALLGLWHITDETRQVTNHADNVSTTL